MSMLYDRVFKVNKNKSNSYVFIINDDVINIMLDTFGLTIDTFTTLVQNLDLSANLTASKDKLNSELLELDSGLVLKFVNNELDNITTLRVANVGTTTQITIRGFPMSNDQNMILSQPAILSLIGDPLFQVLKNVEVKDVASFCSTNVTIRIWCNRKEDDLYRYFLVRDYSIDPRTISIGEAKNVYKNRIRLWKSILYKIRTIIEYTDDMIYNIYHPFDIFTLLYASGDGDNDYVGSIFLGDSNNGLELPRHEKLERFSPLGLGLSDVLEENVYHSIDAKKIKMTYDNIRKFETIDWTIGKNEIERMKVWPEMYAKIMSEDSYWSNSVKLKRNLRENYEYFLDVIKRLRNLQDLDESLTDEEVDYLISIHSRILNGSLKLTDLVLDDSKF